MEKTETVKSSPTLQDKSQVGQPFFVPSMVDSKQSGIMRSSAGPTPFFQPRLQPLVQAKLQVNTPGDSYEQQADAVADQVMRMREGDAPIVQRMSPMPLNGVQRMCSECAANQEEDMGVHRKESSSGDAGGHAAPPIVSQVLASGGGKAMDSDTRQFMEIRFGQDFSAVRLHTDSRAAESARAIQARAYTSGYNVVFGAGEYQPGSEGGKRLLAHELVHVGQQGGEAASMLQRNDESREDAGHVRFIGFPPGGLDDFRVLRHVGSSSIHGRYIVANSWYPTDGFIKCGHRGRYFKISNGCWVTVNAGSWTNPTESGGGCWNPYNGWQNFEDHYPGSWGLHCT